MFYSLQMIFSLYSLLLYANFRSGIFHHLRLRKISKTAIRKHQKGFLNFWFYRDIHKNYGLRFIYSLNIVYSLAWLLHLSVMLLAFVFPCLKMMLLICSCILCMLEVPVVFYTSVNEYRVEFGCGFVLLAKTKETGKLRSSLIDMLSWICSAFLIYLSYRGLS